MSGACHWAAPGVRCVCVDDDWPWIRDGDSMLPVRVPMLGEVLTVTRIEEGDGDGPGRGDVGSLYLFFAEIPTCDEGPGIRVDSVSWRADCFEPLVERKTDISVFTDILDSASADRRVEEPAHGN